MIAVTGACGFIGSCLIAELNFNYRNDIVAVDLFKQPDKICLDNIKNKTILQRIDKDDFIQWLDDNYTEIDFIIHLGAISSTIMFDKETLKKYNTQYTQLVWDKCTQYSIPLIYASSAATYGDGSLGYSDDESVIPNLKPLNPYGESKQAFDVWALEQEEKPPLWYGLKFFNVYGPNEYHKGQMASVVFHAYNQIMKTGKMELFKSYKQGVNNGMQKRDFIYVGDVCNIIRWLMENTPQSGIYNVGTGKARTFYDLARAVFKAMNKKPNIQYIEMPQEIRDKYQYFTEANISKLNNAGYHYPFTNIENGVFKYVTEYLCNLPVSKQANKNKQ